MLFQLGTKIFKSIYEILKEKLLKKLPYSNKYEKMCQKKQTDTVLPQEVNYVLIVIPYHLTFSSLLYLHRFFFFNLYTDCEDTPFSYPYLGHTVYNKYALKGYIY